MRGLRCSPSRKVYFGNIVHKDTYDFIQGEREDVTQDFYTCLLQMFEPNYVYEINDENGRTCYELIIKKIEEDD